MQYSQSNLVYVDLDMAQYEWSTGFKVFLKVFELSPTAV
jgi:hypothetical protein